MKVIFKDVVKRANTKEDRFNTEKIYYVGGEHIHSNELLINERGIIKGSTIGPMFYFGFKAGQVLFVTRNPHLRKAAMVEFDGICSEKTLVLETMNPSVLSQDYLPIIMQSDNFWHYCEEHKSGGVNYFINWSTLADYEFELPSLEEQHSHSQKIWAAYRLRESYKKLLAATDEMVKSQFIEMYHKTHNTQTLESVCAIISKGITPKYVDFSSVAVVNQACIQWDGQHLENIKYHNEEILFKKRTLQTGDVLLNATGTGTLGRCCVFNCPSNDNIYINDGHVIALATDKSILLPEVLKAYLSLNDTQAEIYRLYVTGSTNQVDIVFSDIKKMKVPVPDIDDQISFVKILNQADKSKFGDFKSQFIEMLFKKPITGKIGDLVDKKIFSVKKIHSMNDIIEYIDISSVERSNHSIVETTSYVVSNAPSRAQQCVRLDDILVSTVRPINRNIAVVNSDKNNLVASTGFCVLRPKLAFKEYLLAIVQSDKYTEAMIDKASGGLYPAVNNGDVLNYGIYIPDEEFAKKFSLIYQQADKSKSYVRIALKNLESILGYCIRQVA